MAKKLLMLLVLVCFLTLGFGEKKRYIVKLEHPDGKPHGLGQNQAGYSKARHALQKELQKAGIKMKEIKKLGLLNSVVIEIEEEDAEAVGETAGVVSIQEDEPVYLDVIEAVPQVEGPQAHSLGFTGAGIKVGIIDTGLDYNHPDIAPNYAGGYDFAYDDNDPMDGGTVLRKSSFSVKASAVDNVGVDKVVFRMDGYLKCTDREMPYECSMYAPAKPNARLRIEVQAVDEAGNSDSQAITITTIKTGRN